MHGRSGSLEGVNAQHDRPDPRLGVVKINNNKTLHHDVTMTHYTTCVYMYMYIHIPHEHTTVHEQDKEREKKRQR